MKDFLHAGVKSPHAYFFYSEQNIFFCNIPKCASTTINNYIKNNPLLVFNEPFYFTVIREPIARLKSALWMISYMNHTPVDIFYCPHCGGNSLLNEFNLDKFVKQIKNIEQIGVPENLLMHAFPQSLFIDNSPYPNPQDLKIYRMDQIDQIFNTKLPKENANDIDNATYKRFEKNFEEQYSKYDRFLNNYFIDDFKLWNLANT